MQCKMKIVVCLLFVAFGLVQAVDWAEVRPVNIFQTPVKDLAANGGRIIEGSEATPGQFPYMVALILDGVGVCGASLISDRVVLTAGHCVDGFLTIEVHLGAHNLYDETEEGRVVTITRVFAAHEDYDLFTINNDLGLVHLREPVVTSPTIQIARLPSRSQAGETFVGSVAITSGWGLTNSSFGSVSPVLMFAEMRVITNAECTLSYPEGFLVDTMLCTLPVTGKDCNSDSGGPLALTESDGGVTQIGVMSFGSSRVCETLDPDGFTRLTSYLDWLEVNAGVVIRP